MEAQVWSPCSWPRLIRVSSVERPKHPLIQRYTTDDVSRNLQLSHVWDTALTPLSTSRQTSCAYHPLAQWTVYHHVSCFMILLSPRIHYKPSHKYACDPINMFIIIYLVVLLHFNLNVAHILCFYFYFIFLVYFILLWNCNIGKLRVII